MRLFADCKFGPTSAKRLSLVPVVGKERATSLLMSFSCFIYMFLEHPRHKRALH